jgi:uncharacterized protein
VIIATIAWQSDAGADHCVIDEHRDGFSVRGSAIVVEGSLPYFLRYAVQVDREWRTRHVVVHVSERDQESNMHLVVEGGTWKLGRQERLDLEERADLAGCSDVDLAFTPATNTLPIRRLGLDAGDAADVGAAWVRWPALDVVPAQQRYERLTADRYRFAQDDFSAEIAVDSDGLVREYADIWRAIGRA